jgi:hypothetical protein
MIGRLVTDAGDAIKKTKFTEAQIVSALRQIIAKVCYKMGVSEATHYN